MAKRAKQTFSVEELLKMLRDSDEADSGGDGESDDDWSLDGSADSDSEEDDQLPAKRSRVSRSSQSGDTVQGMFSWHRLIVISDRI